MELIKDHILSLILWFPLIGLVIIPFLKERQRRLIRWITLIVLLFDFLLSLYLVLKFDFNYRGFQFVEKTFLIPSLNAFYYLGVDGLSVLFVPLSLLVSVLCVLISWRSITHKVKEFHLFLLFVTITMVGTFISLDLLLFYLFWEALLIPMYFIIGIWGSKRRIYATLKFFLYTFFGSVFLLVSIMYLWAKFGTFDITVIESEIGKTLSYSIRELLFWGFLIAFAIKIPMWPVHTWLPDAHTEAPTAGSVILAGILIKIGAYGILRFCFPFFPEVLKEWAPFLMILSAIAVVYGGLACLAQKDIKRLIAYSSVSHMGIVTLGIFAMTPLGIKGGIFQMIAHGIITGALFMCIGIIYDRTHTREISYYSGLATTFPLYSAFFMVFVLASIGLPGTNGFIGEFTSLLGAFVSGHFGITALSALSLILGACYMLWLYRRVFFNEVRDYLKNLEPLKINELASLIPMLVFVFLFGLYPKLLFNYFELFSQYIVK